MQDNLKDDWKKGEHLDAKFVSQVGQHVNKFERMTPGSFLNMHHSGSSVGFSGRPGTLLVPAVISNLIMTEGDTAGSGLYKIRLRWHNAKTGVWHTDGDKEWNLDERGINTPPTFSVADKVIVYWDEQRGLFIPIVMSTVLQSVVTNWRVSGNTIQIKTRDIFVMPAEDESDWTTVHTGNDCS